MFLVKEKRESFSTPRYSDVSWLYYSAGLVAVIFYKFSSVLQQKHYAFLAIKNRHKPYDPSVWDEKDPEILLWKVGGLIGRSGSAVIGLFGIDMARVALMGYIVFRTQDTWADVAVRRTDRLKGLSLLPKRYNKLEKSDDFFEADEVDDVKWDLESRERNRLYVDVTKRVDRFDPIYKKLIPLHREILRNYAEDLAVGWSELEMLEDAPITPQIMRKHAEVAIDVGFFGMCRGTSPILYRAIQKGSEEPKARQAYISFSNYVWYLNLAASIEEDVAEGVALDEELRSMNGELQQEVVDRVRVKWLIFATSELLKCEAFLFHPGLAMSWTLRLFVLQFLKTSVNVCEKYVLLLKEGTHRKSVGAYSVYMNFISSLTLSGFEGAVKDSLQYSGKLFAELREIKGDA